MLNPNIYKVYKINSIKIKKNTPEFFEIKLPFSGYIYTTSCYFTDTNFNSLNSDYYEYINLIKNYTRSKKLKYILIKTRDEMLANYLKNEFYIDENYVTYQLNLKEGIENVWQKLPAKTRNQVRKGYKFNPSIKIGKVELLNDFYNVIAKTQTELGTPVHSKKYYNEIISSMDKTKLIVIYLNNKPVSAALLVQDDKIMYHPNAGTIKKYNKLSINNVLYWEIIKFAIQIGCTSFDMGRSSLNSGTAKYKESWNGNLIKLYYCYYLGKRQSIPKYGTKFMQFLTFCWKVFIPVFLAKKLGHYLIRYIP